MLYLLQQLVTDCTSLQAKNFYHPSMQYDHPLMTSSKMYLLGLLSLSIPSIISYNSLKGTFPHQLGRAVCLS